MAENEKIAGITTKEPDSQGLYEKYSVVNVKTGRAIKDCFVLRPDRDRAAAAALRAYAEVTENKALADDIIRWVGPDDQRVRTGKGKWHLCDTCAKEFPECPPSAHITFGNGKGNDNVIACDAWEEAQRAELPNRPLTLDEFKIAPPTVAWIELREADRDILAAVFTDEGVYEVQNGLPWEDIYYDFQGFEYGTGFRVWSGLFHGKPTDEERASVMWNAVVDNP